jgi:hypothetical protein
MGFEGAMLWFACQRRVGFIGCQPWWAEQQSKKRPKLENFFSLVN